MRHFNAALRQSRLERGLTLRELAKEVHIHWFQLYLMEKGYLKPSVGKVAVLNRFFAMDFADLLEGEASYPVPVDEYEPSEREVKARERFGSKKTRAILLAGAFLSLLVGAAGGGLIAAAHYDGDNMFGLAYRSVRDAAKAKGMHSYNTITGAETCTYSQSNVNEIVHLTFEMNNSLLNFNTNLFSSIDNNERYIYQFGFDMSVDSYVAQFTYGRFADAEFANCRFTLVGDINVESIYDLKIVIDDHNEITEALMLEKLNYKLPSALASLGSTMSDLIGNDLSFQRDFLSARETGRVRNFRMQGVGAIMAVLGVVAFVAFLLVFISASLINTQAKLEVAVFDDVRRGRQRGLPTDPSVAIGLPETFIKSLGILALLIAAVIYGMIFVRQFGQGVSPTSSMTAWASVAMATGIFLLHFLNFEIKSKTRSLIGNLLLFGGLYLAVSGMETIVVLVARTWGYSIQDLVVSKLPSNIFGIAAAHYLIMLFLFTEPKFAVEGKKWHRIFWHSLSILPLGFLIVSYVLGNYASVVYGAQYNALIYIWFPRSFLALSVVCVIYLYGVFIMRLLFTGRYGPEKAAVYFTGNTFSFLKNALGASAILLVGLVDFFLRNTPYFAFLGIGNNYWILLLIPFILLHKHHIGPRNPKIDGVFAIIYMVLYWISFLGILSVLVSRMI